MGPVMKWQCIKGLTPIRIRRRSRAKLLERCREVINVGANEEVGNGEETKVLG